MNNRIDDGWITKRVRAVKNEVPAGLKRELYERILSEARQISRKRARRLLWLSTPALTLAVILWLIFSPFNIQRSPSITEIRTDLEVPGTNIKIIWIQKENFSLRRIKK